MGGGAGVVGPAGERRGQCAPQTAADGAPAIEVKGSAAAGIVEGGQERGREVNNESRSGTAKDGSGGGGCEGEQRLKSIGGSGRRRGRGKRGHGGEGAIDSAQRGELGLERFAVMAGAERT